MRTALLSLLIPLVFGMPFLLLTDLFPFHRYGMFARMPQIVPAPKVRILLANADSSVVLQTGSPCLDRALIPKMARAAFCNSVAAEVLLEKLRPALNPFPDSIFVEQEITSGWDRRILYP